MSVAELVGAGFLWCSVGSQGFQVMLNKRSWSVTWKEWLCTKDSMGRNINSYKARKTHQRDPQDEGIESSKSMKTSGEGGEQIICDLAASKQIGGSGRERMVSLPICPPSFIGASQSTLQAAAL